MLNKGVLEWIETLREEDRNNTLKFLEVSLDYFDSHPRFLSGSGFYVVGSSLSKRMYVFKNQERIKKLKKESIERMEKRFGKEKLVDYKNDLLRIGSIELVKSHRKVFHYEHIPLDEYIEAYKRTHNFFDIPTKKLFDEDFESIRQAYAQENELLKIEALRRDFYEDIDLALSGLTQEKSNPGRIFWRGFLKRMDENFPNTIQMKYGITPFGEWNVYDWDEMLSQYVVRDLNLKIPNQKSFTEMHFMIYKSDERFGARVRDVYFHEPSEDVNRNMWKEQQKRDNLSYLMIGEF